MLVSDIEEFAALSETLQWIANIDTAGLARFSRNVQHEADHGYVASLLGAKAVFYSLSLYNAGSNKSPVYTWAAQCRPRGWHTNRLGAATWYARPLLLSGHDVTGFQHLGFPTLHMVTRAAKQHGYPQPLSHIRSPARLAGDT